MIEFAVNYSPRLAGLVQSGQLRVDRYKCPAWPLLIEEALTVGPVYVHFPLSIGSGQGGPLDEEKKRPADLGRVAELLEQSGTPLVNTHLSFAESRYPHIPHHSRDPVHLREVLDGALRDLEPLLMRFGPERITVENVLDEFGWLTATVLPEVIQRLLEETGCGFLFDLSHARLAARSLGVAEREYISALPVDRMKEAHITGLQVLEGPLLEMMLAAGDPHGMAKHMTGKYIDHVPMLAEDWPALEWMMDQIRTHPGWASPWVIAFEYGGVGPFWDNISSEAVYLEQLPPMAEIIHRGEPVR